MIREVLHKLKLVICQLLVTIYRRYYIPSPEIEDIAHYACCPNCRSCIEAQGWLVDFKHRNNKIYEVTFKARENGESKQFSGECFGDEEERPKRRSASIYV